MRKLTLALCLAAGPALAGPYAQADLAARQPAEAARLMEIFETDLLAFLPADQRAAATGIALQVPLEMGPPTTVVAEPTTRQIFVPVASVQFFRDMVLLYSWTSEGRCPQEMTAAVDSYLYALLVEGRDLPPPLQAFGVDRAAALSTNEDFAALIEFSEDTVVTFLLAHELGHLLLEHRAGLPPEASRMQEAEADDFAMDHFLRAEVPPFGLHLLFLTSRMVDPVPGDAGLSTHPVSTERLLTVGGRMKTDAAAHANAYPQAQGLAQQLAGLGSILTDELPAFAELWNDPELRTFYGATITTMAPPEDLAGICPTR